MWIPGLWINPTLFQAALFVTAAWWALQMAYRPYRPQGGFVLFPLAAAAMWPLIQLSAHTTVSRWETWYALLLWMGNLTACALALQVADSRAVRKRLLDLLLAFGVLISVISVLQHFSTPAKIFWIFDDAGRQVFGPFGNRDRYAAFAELLMPLAVVRAVREVHGRRILWFTLIAATLFASVIAAASRAGAILIFVESVLVLVAVRRGAQVNSSRFRATVAVFIVLCFLFTAVVGYTILIQRFDEQTPFASRKGMLLAAMNIAKDRPWLGVGLGNFENAYSGYAVIEMNRLVNHAHNDWAEWAAEGGFPFAVIILSLVGWILPRLEKVPWGIGLLGLLTHSLVDFPMQSPVMAFWVFTLLGIFAAESRQIKRRG